jgi:hypothetical protein
MDKTGFVVKVTSRGREYFYLRRSFWKDNRPQNKNIYSFGSRRKALENLRQWQEEFNTFPDELKEMGFAIQDVSRWIEQIKNK